MKLVKAASAGTVESSDIMVTVEPNDQDGIQIDLQSSVEKQFGQQIEKVLIETIQRLGLDNVNVIAVDQGALDCTVQARTIVAAYRAAGESDYNWEELSKWNV